MRNNTYTICVLVLLAASSMGAFSKVSGASQTMKDRPGVSDVYKK